MIEPWTAKECAAYLKVSYSQFIKHVQFDPTFPKRIRETGHPRWVSSEVQAWGVGYRVAA